MIESCVVLEKFLSNQIRLQKTYVDVDDHIFAVVVFVEEIMQVLGTVCIQPDIFDIYK